MSASPPLIGLAHGSRDPRAAAQILALMDAVGELRSTVTTVAAFLDLSDPDLAGAVQQLGASTAVVVPLLFTEAFHTRIDTPAAVDQVSAGTGTRLIQARHLGLGAAVLAGLQLRAAQAGIEPNHEILLLAVGSSDRSANAAVAELADRWAALRPGGVRARFATTDPRADDDLAGGFDGAIVPLFLAHGLLLDATEKQAAARGMMVAAPLGTALAPLVLERYDEAIRQR